MATKTQYSVLDFFYFFFNYKLIPLLARIFGSLCHSGLDPESILSCPSCKFVVVSLCLSVASVANYTFPLLARNFGAAQGVCLPDTGYVLSYIEDVRTGKNNAVIAKKNRQKMSKNYCTKL